ncbi:hypothetical protein KEM48_006402 [Puccinia striiformis f. sp. tritici PST-130]|nr:hypothetical protein KEM48_006402 [Puccinia striiformis f. sp. tritici PST-130]
MSIEDSHQTPHAPPYSSNISKSDLLSALVRRYASDQEDPHVDEETWISGSNLSKFISSFSAASGVCWMSKDCFEEYERFAAQHPNLELTLSKVADMLCELQKVRNSAKPLDENLSNLSHFETNVDIEVNSIQIIRGLSSEEAQPDKNPASSIRFSAYQAFLPNSYMLQIDFQAQKHFARENVISELQDLIRKLALNRNTQPDQCTITDSGSPALLSQTFQPQ